MDIVASVVLLWLMRPVAIAGVSGGFASLALSVLREAVLEGGGPDFSTCPICPSLEAFSEVRPLDPFSVVVGVFVGLAKVLELSNGSQTVDPPLLRCLPRIRSPRIQHHPILLRILRY